MTVSAAASTSRRSRLRRSSFVGQLGGAVRIARGEEFDDVGGDVHAARGVDAWGEAESDVEAGDLLAGWIERGSGKERAQPGAHGAAQLAQAKSRDRAILAVEGNGVGDGGDGGHLEKAGKSFFAQASGITANSFGLVETGLLKQRLR